MWHFYYQKQRMPAHNRTRLFVFKEGIISSHTFQKLTERVFKGMSLPSGIYGKEEQSFTSVINIFMVPQLESITISLSLVDLCNFWFYCDCLTSDNLHSSAAYVAAMTSYLVTLYLIYPPAPTPQKRLS